MYIVFCLDKTKFEKAWTFSLKRKYLSKNFITQRTKITVLFFCYILPSFTFNVWPLFNSSFILVLYLYYNRTWLMTRDLFIAFRLFDCVPYSMVFTAGYFIGIQYSCNCSCVLKSWKGPFSYLGNFMVN